MNLSQRAARKVRHLCHTRVEERLFAEGLVPAVVPRLLPPRRRTPPDPATVESVLVWNVDSLGDFLLTTPCLRALRDGYPRAKITLVCNRVCQPLADMNPHADRVIALDPAPFYKGRGLFRQIAELAGRRYDVMAVLEMGSRPADAGRILGRRLDVGYLVSTNLGILKALPDHTLAPNRDAYWASYFLRAVEHLGLIAGPPALEVFTTAADESEADAVLGPVREGGAATVGLHPHVAPYAALTKKWPDDSFVELARILAARRAIRFVLTGSAEEAPACARLAERISAVTDAAAISTAGRLSLRALAVALRRLDALVVADTAVLHLAAAIGTPTVALFGATDDRLVAPPSPQCVVLNQRLPCSPCLAHRDRRPAWPRCIFDHPKCMHEITPAAVADVLFKFVPAGLTGPRPRSIS